MFPHDWGYPYICLIWLAGMTFCGTMGLAMCLGASFGGRAVLIAEVVLFTAGFSFAYFGMGIGRG